MAGLRKLSYRSCVFCIIFLSLFIVFKIIEYRPLAQGAQQVAEAYLAIKWKLNKNILSQVDKYILSKIVPNRNKIVFFLSTIIFCGTHDIALQGKHSDTGYVQNFHEF